MCEGGSTLAGTGHNEAAKAGIRQGKEVAPLKQLGWRAANYVPSSRVTIILSHL